MKGNMIFRAFVSLVVMALFSAFAAGEAATDEPFILTGGNDIGRFSADESFTAISFEDAPSYTSSDVDYYPESIAVSGSYMYALYDSQKKLATIRRADYCLVSKTSISYTDDDDNTYHPSALSVSGGFLYCLYGTSGIIGKYDISSSFSKEWVKAVPKYLGYAPETITAYGDHIYVLFNSGKRVGKYSTENLSLVWTKPTPTTTSTSILYPEQLAVSSGVIYFMFSGHQKFRAYAEITSQLALGKKWLASLPLSASDTSEYPKSIAVSDVTAPAGTIAINGGSGYVNSTEVTLSLAASDSGGNGLPDNPFGVLKASGDM